MEKNSVYMQCRALCPFRLKVEVEFICTIDNTACINLAKADAYCGHDSYFIGPACYQILITWFTQIPHFDYMVQPDTTF